MKKQLEIISAYGTDYKIMCPTDERKNTCYGFEKGVPTPLYAGLCEKIRLMFAEMGVETHVIPYEETTPDDKVIIVGPTDEVCDRMLMKDVRTYQYIVRSSGNRIVIGAWLDHQLKLATDHFIDMIKSQWTDSGYLTIDAPDEIITMPMKKRPADAPNAYKDFVFMYYGGPGAAQLDDELMSRLRDVGITRLMLGGEGRENLLHAAELAKKYGMDITIRASTEETFGNLIYKTKATETDEEIEYAVKNIVDTYGDIPEIVEWYICDEPKRRNAENLARIVKAFRKFDPSRPQNVNHYPGSGWRYHDYLNTFVEKTDPDMLSFDRYLLVGPNPPALLTNDLFDSLLLVSDMAHRNDFPAKMICQLAEVNDLTPTRMKIMDPEVLRWQSNGIIAYGYKCVSHFLLTQMFKNNWKELDDQYYVMKAIAPKVCTHGRLLAKKKFEMVYHINTDQKLGAPKYIPFGDLGEVEGENGIISFFDDGTFFLVNYVMDPTKSANTITIGEYNGTSLEWYDTSDETWKDAVACENITLTNGVYELSLASGDAEALRVVK